MKKNIEIIALIYKSVAYLDFIVEQLRSKACVVPGWHVGIRVVANDATDAVLDRLAESGIPFSVYQDPNPTEFYLNRVYRCWNYGGYTSKFDNICFVNSDMAFSCNWLTNLVKHHDGTMVPTSRLIESGRIPVAVKRHAIPWNLGTSPESFQQQRFEALARTLSEDSLLPSGLFMPCVFDRHKFVELGMYPEGNVLQC